MGVLGALPDSGAPVSDELMRGWGLSQGVGSAGCGCHAWGWSQWGRGCRQRAGRSSTPGPSCPWPPALPSLPPPIPPPSLGTPLPTPGRCLPPPAFSQPLPLRFSFAGPRRKVDVRCVHAPGAAGWVGALHWWGRGCMRFHLHPLRLPQLPSSHPGVGPDPDLHPQAENGEGPPLTPVTPRHSSSPSTSCSLSCPPECQLHAGPALGPGRPGWRRPRPPGARV